MLAGVAFGAVSAYLLNRLVYTPFCAEGRSCSSWSFVSLTVGIVVGRTPSWQCEVQPSSHITSTWAQLCITLDFVLDTSQLMIMGRRVAAMIIVQLLAFTRTRRPVKTIHTGDRREPGWQRHRVMATDRIVRT